MFGWNNDVTTAADMEEAQSKAQIERLEKLLSEVQKQSQDTQKGAKTSLLIAVFTLAVALLTLIATVLTLFLVRSVHGSEQQKRQK